MHIVFARPDPRRVLATLREGAEIAEVYGWQPELAADGLLAAIESAEETGYGDATVSGGLASPLQHLVTVTVDPLDHLIRDVLRSGTPSGF